MLVRERRSFAQVKLPYDCRELLRFIREMREYDMVAKLDYADEEDFIRRGLELDPVTVEEALVMLERIKPEWAVPFRAAADIGKAILGKDGGDRRSEAFKEQRLLQHGGDRKSDQSSNTRLKSTGKRCNAAYIRARLERDGHTELLEKIERGETSAHAVAVQLGWRTRMVQVPPTVEGFARAARKHLDAAQVHALKEQL